MDRLTCSICKDNFNMKEKLPQVGECEHIYCLECIQQNSNEGKFICQACDKCLIVADMKDDEISKSLITGKGTIEEEEEFKIIEEGGKKKKVRIVKRKIQVK